MGKSMLEDKPTVSGNKDWLFGLSPEKYLENILINSKPLDPEFAQILHDSFWELLAS